MGERRTLRFGLLALFYVAWVAFSVATVSGWTVVIPLTIGGTLAGYWAYRAWCEVARRR